MSLSESELIRILHTHAIHALLFRVIPQQGDTLQIKRPASSYSVSAFTNAADSSILSQPT